MILAVAFYTTNRYNNKILLPLLWENTLFPQIKEVCIHLHCNSAYSKHQFSVGREPSFVYKHTAMEFGACVLYVCPMRRSAKVSSIMGVYKVTEWRNSGMVIRHVLQGVNNFLCFKIT